VKNVADLYRLHREDLLTLGTNVGKSTDRLLAAIEQSKHAELWRVIAGLGIPGVGAVASHDLARHFGSLESLARLNREDAPRNDRAVDTGIGETTTRAIDAFFAHAENQVVVSDLLALGMRPVAPTSSPATAPDG
jgi:DNA ligase (NAD+)